MSNKWNSDAFLDVDCVTLKPSPQRIRNILTLEERVAAIKAYDVRPMYTKVAKMFNCSWEQIKNIIANRHSILEFYEATKSIENQPDPQTDIARKRKIEFLDNCVYEYIQRLHFHNKVDISEELIRCKALEFRDVIRVDNFMPTKAWINQFKTTFNISLSNRQLKLTRTPPSSLDLRDIMTYCTKLRTQKNSGNQVTQGTATEYRNMYRPSTQIALSHENDATADELRQRRQRKLNFLERALLEYATRAKFHLKVTLDDELLCSTATSLRDMLKVDNFVVNIPWLKSFKTRYNFETLVQSNLATSTRTPPLSLDLKDILSYCSRLEKNTQISAADNFQRQQAVTSRMPAITIISKNSLASSKPQTPMVHITRQTNSLRDIHKPLDEVKSEIIDLEDDEPLESILTAKPIKRSSPEISNQPILKIRKIESMCAGNETEYILPPSPGHWSENSDDNINNKIEENLPKVVQNYEDALKLLKPLEEFAMLQENFRAIGLIEQLESIFKNPPNREDDDIDN